MAKASPKSQEAYLYDILEAAQLIRGYIAGVSFEDFWNNSEKRDAVALRITVLGESAKKISKATEAAFPGVRFKEIRGMRNRIAHDYGAVDFKIVWDVTEKEIEPLIGLLSTYFKGRTVPNTESSG
jgi:uncharacterized protein with HEPN domain